jgi:glycosyltransferase involved in cell wall biosynthesis
LGGGAGIVGRARRFLQIVRILRRYPGCFVHLVEGWPAGDALVFAAARAARVKAIIRTEQQPPVQPVSRWQRLLTRVKDRFTRRIVCVSEDNAEQHRRALGRSGRKIAIVHNCIDTSPFDPQRRVEHARSVRREFGIPESAFLVGFVGRLDEERKGLRYFIEMAATLRAAHEDVGFLVVGDGSLRPQAEQLAQSLGLSAVLTFTGTRDDVPPLLGAMDVFVQPSLAEGASYIQLEALAAGTPVVSTRAGAAAEVIKSGVNGILVPMRDPQAMADAVQRLLDDDRLRECMGARGAETVEQRFTAEAMVERYVQLYREVGAS